jgi:hypothetical protein
VHDAKIQARAADLVVGTHGRSIFRADLEELRQMTPDRLALPLYVFAPDTLRYDDSWGAKPASWRAANVPTVTVSYLSSGAGTATVTVATPDGVRLQTLTHEADAGLNYLAYDLTVDPEQAEAFNAQVEAESEGAESSEDEPATLEPADDGAIYLVPGTYPVTIQRGDASVETTLTIEASPEPRRAAPRMAPSESEEIK